MITADDLWVLCLAGLTTIVLVSIFAIAAKWIGGNEARITNMVDTALNQPPDEWWPWMDDDPAALLRAELNNDAAVVLWLRGAS